MIVEYAVEDGVLERWQNPPDRTRAIVDEAISLACTSLSAEGVEVSIALGTAQLPAHLYLILAEETGTGP